MVHQNACSTKESKDFVEIMNHLLHNFKKVWKIYFLSIVSTHIWPWVQYAKMCYSQFKWDWLIGLHHFNIIYNLYHGELCFNMVAMVLCLICHFMFFLSLLYNFYDPFIILCIYLLLYIFYSVIYLSSFFSQFTNNHFLLLFFGIKRKHVFNI